MFYHTFLRHWWRYFAIVQTSQLSDQKSPDSTRMPGRLYPTHPLPGPWSGAEHIYTPPMIMFSLPALLHIHPQALPTELEVSILWVRRSVVIAWAWDLPCLLTPKINFSLSLFQTLVSWIIDFSCNVFILSLYSNSIGKHSQEEP